MRPNHRLLTLAGTLIALCATAIGGSSSLAAITHTDGSYLLDLPLSRPTTVAPSNDAALTYPTNPIKLSWRPVPGAAKYDVQVARQSSSDDSCGSATAWQVENILFTYTTTELGWVPELLTPETGSDIWTGTFCWRVRASGTVPGLWSTSSRFTITWPARATNLRFYADENGDLPRSGPGDATGFDTGYLQWSGVGGASRYEVQISEAPSFSATSLFATKTYPGTRMLLPQMPDNNYSWRVRPIAGNGVYGTWSEVATFTIRRDTRYWTSDSSSLYPLHGSTVHDVRIGFEPVPGASYYRYMAATNPAAFTELDSQGAYGTPGENCIFYNSRLSSSDEAKSSTINSWVTLGALLDPAVITNLYTWCDLGGGSYVRPTLPSAIHWRVYPVWQLSSATETGWKVASAKIVGSAVQRTFNLQPYTTALTTDPVYGKVPGARCRLNTAPAAGEDCLRLIGGAMSPKNPSIHSTTMQVPYFDFGAYPGRDTVENGAGPGAFRVQIARDSEFNNQVLPEGANNLIRGWISAKGPLKRDARAEDSIGMTRFGQIHRSFALTTGLPDEGQDGNGYFWRSLPCQSPDSKQNQHVLCNDFYSDQTEDIWSPGMRFGEPSSGALEFRKRVEAATGVVENFSGTMPMLRVGPVGASTYGEWQRGIQGADHYEFELSRDQSFGDEGDRTLKTTVPRIVPWGATPADLLEAGTWFWRVRAIDRDGLTGTWSATTSFSIAAPSPVVSDESASMGVGATVQWEPVGGATQYEVSWSADAAFASATTKVSRQTAYHIPASQAGRQFWRVRAQTGASSFGAWSAPRAVTILSPTRIPFGVSRGVVTAGSPVIVEGQLIVAGTPRNAQRVTLQRKTAACGARGGYRSLTSAVSGRNLDDGFVRLRVRAATSACYRLSWAHANGVVHSAPFAIGARPRVAFRPTSTSVRRGTPFCSLIRSAQPVTGTLQVQYRVKKTWVTARTARVRGMRTRMQCAAINRGGTFPVRLVLDGLVHPARGSKLYERTIVFGGSIRTNDMFQIIR